MSEEESDNSFNFNSEGDESPILEPKNENFEVNVEDNKLHIGDLHQNSQRDVELDHINDLNQTPQKEVELSVNHVNNLNQVQQEEIVVKENDIIDEENIQPQIQHENTDQIIKNETDIIHQENIQPSSPQDNNDKIIKTESDAIHKEDIQSPPQHDPIEQIKNNESDIIHEENIQAEVQHDPIDQINNNKFDSMLEESIHHQLEESVIIPIGGVIPINGSGDDSFPEAINPEVDVCENGQQNHKSLLFRTNFIKEAYKVAKEDKNKICNRLKKYHFKVKHSEDFNTLFEEINANKLEEKKTKKVNNLYREKVAQNVSGDIDSTKTNKIETGSAVGLIYGFFLEFLKQLFYHSYWILIFAIQQIGSLQNPTFNSLESTFIIPVIISIIFISIMNTIQHKRKLNEITKYNDRLVEKKDTTASWKPVKSSSIRPGDIIRIPKEQDVPADLLILHAYPAEKPEQKIPEFITNVDGVFGESTQQSKIIHQIFFDINVKKILDGEGLINIRMIVGKSPSYFKPYKGILGVGPKSDLRVKNIEDSHFLLKGSRFSYADYVIGCVCFTGNDTRVMKDFPSVKSKSSHLEILTRRMMLLIFILQLILSFAQGATYMTSYHIEAPYINTILALNHSNYIVTTLENWARWLTLLSSSLPFSLFITIYCTRMIQGLVNKMGVNGQNNIFQFESTMKYDFFNSKCLENLGHVEYIACDKTGTLTDNNLKMQQLAIDNHIFGNEYGKGLFDKHQSGIHKGQFKDSKLQEMISHQNCEEGNQKNLVLSVLNFDNLKQKMQEISRGNSYQSALMCMVMCHQVKIKSNNQECLYSGTSQEEVNMLNWARECGHEFLRKTPHQITIKVHKNCHNFENCSCEIKEYEILYEIPFNSTRKRMTVIVKDNKTKKIRAFMKGAVADIKPRLNKKMNSEGSNLATETEELAQMGYRTLALAERTYNQYQWNIMWERIKDSFNDDPEEKDSKYALLEIEYYYKLLSVVYFKEDIRADTIETIKNLKNVGIRFLMLTGDNASTTKHVAYASGIFDKNASGRVGVSNSCIEFKIDENKLKSEKEKYLQRITDTAFEKFGKKTGEGGQLCLLVHANYLENLCDNEECEEALQKFIRMVMYSDACVFCRLTPYQKGQVIRLIKDNNKSANILAQGNGLNDSHMFAEADTSIGLIQAPKLQFELDSSILELSGNYTQVYIDNKQILPSTKSNKNASMMENLRHSKCFNIYDPKDKFKIEIKTTKGDNKCSHLKTLDFFVKDIPIVVKTEKKGYGNNFRNEVTEPGLTNTITIPEHMKNVDYPNAVIKWELSNTTVKKKDVNVIGTDVNITELKMLEQLILNIGAEHYRKNSMMILYVFYKGIVITTPQVLFGFISGFSGTMIYDNLHFEAYTYCYTAFAIIYFAVSDQTISPCNGDLKAYYSECQNLKQSYKGNYPNNMKAANEFYLRAIWWIIKGMTSGAMIFAGALYNIEYQETNGTSDKFGVWSVGLLAVVGSTIVCNQKILQIQHNLGFHTIAWIFLGIGLSLLVWYIRDSISGSDRENLFMNLIQSQTFIFFIILCIGVSVADYSICKLIEILQRPEIDRMSEIRKEITILRASQMHEN